MTKNLAIVINFRLIICEPPDFLAQPVLLRYIVDLAQLESHRNHSHSNWPTARLRHLPSANLTTRVPTANRPPTIANTTTMGRSRVKWKKSHHMPNK